MLSLTQVFQSQVNIIVLLIPLDAAGLKIDWSVPRNTKRSIRPEVPQCCLSQMCSSNPPAGLRAGHGGMKYRENGHTQQRTSLWLHEYLELADCTQAVFSSTGFLFIETFLLPPFCHFWDKSLSTGICESHCLDATYHKC